MAQQVRQIVVGAMTVMLLRGVAQARHYSDAVKDLNPQIYYRMSDPNLVYADAVDNEMTDDGGLDGLMGFPGGYPESAPHAGAVGPRPSDTIGGQALVGLESDNYGMEFTGWNGVPNSNTADLIYIGDLPAGHVLDSALASYSFFFKTMDVGVDRRITSTDSVFAHRFEIMMDLGKIVLVNAVGDADCLQTVNTYNDGLWHHLVAVRNSDTAGDVKLFIDGAAPAAEVISYDWSTNTRCRIGAQGTNTNAWIGILDEYTHYTVALSDTQAGELFEAALSGAAVIITPMMIEVTEGQDPNSYQIVLATEPTAPVEITALPDDEEVDIGSGAGASLTLTFGTLDWQTPRTVTVTAVDDEYDEDDPHTTRIMHSAQSSDENYHNIPISNVDVRVRDNDMVCGDWGYLQADFNMDCKVDLLDLALLAQQWLKTME